MLELKLVDEVVPNRNSDVADRCDVPMAEKSPSILKSPSACSEVAIMSDGRVIGEEPRSINGEKIGSGVSSDGSMVAAEDAGGQGNVTSYTGRETACVIVDGPVVGALDVSWIDT